MHNLARGENTLRFPLCLGCPITSILHSKETLAGTAFSPGAACEFFYLLSFPCIPPLANESMHNCPSPPPPESVVPCSSFSLLSWPCSGNEQAEKLQIDYKPSPCRD